MGASSSLAEVPAAVAAAPAPPDDHCGDHGPSAAPSDALHAGDAPAPLGRAPASAPAMSDAASPVQQMLHPHDAPAAPAPGAIADVEGVADPAPASSPRDYPGYSPLLILICAVGDATYMSLAPFLPQRAAERGLSPASNGLIFSCFMWGGLAFTPAAARLSRSTRPRALLSVCVLLQAALTAAFAAAPALPLAWQWFALAFTLRLLQGIVACIYEVSVSSLIMCAVPPERVGAALGVQEAARGVGMMIGPSLGGLLYAAGGFALPFLASAAALAVLGVAIALTLDDGPRTLPEEGANPVTFAQILRLPSVSVATALLTALAMALSVLDPILGPYEHDRFQLSASTIGLIFSAATLSYALLSPLVGFIGSVLGNFRTLVSGMLLTAIAFFILGPCPWLPEGLIQPRVWLLVVGMLVLGLGASTLTCSVPCMLEVCNRAGLETEEVSDVIGALLSFSWSLGALGGPLYGSALVQAYGFSQATSATGVLLVVLTVLGVGVHVVWERLHGAAQGDELATAGEQTAVAHREAGRRGRTKQLQTAARAAPSLAEPLLDPTRDD